MSQQYDDTNRGALFTNDRKETDSHPDFTGKLNVEGKEYWLSAWKKEGNGKRFLSVSVKPKEAAPARAQQAKDEAFADDTDWL